MPAPVPARLFDGLAQMVSATLAPFLGGLAADRAAARFFPAQLRLTLGRDGQVRELVDDLGSHVSVLIRGPRPRRHRAARHGPRTT